MKFESNVDVHFRLTPSPMSAGVRFCFSCGRLLCMTPKININNILNIFVFIFLFPTSKYTYDYEYNNEIADCEYLDSVEYV